MMFGSTKVLGVVSTLLFGVMVAFMGCEMTPVNVDINNDEGHTTLGLDYRDFEFAATNSVNDLLSSGCLSRPGKKYVLIISRIKNDTVADVDPDQLIKKMRVMLMRSGKVEILTGMGINGPEDKIPGMIEEETGVETDMTLPDLSLSGKIIGKTHRYDSSTQQLEYYLQLTLTDVKRKVSVWEDERKIVKRGSSRSVSW